MMPKVPEQKDQERKFAPEKVKQDQALHPKDPDQKGQNIQQNTRNQGYQQDR
jgi:hypothetical protein